MKREEIKDVIIREKLIAIVRTKEPGSVEAIIDGLVEGGVKVLEITSNTPDFEKAIQESRKRHPEVLVGAGTVTNQFIALKAIKAGAQFLVSPNAKTDLVRTAHENEIPMVLGALTPTEVAEAVEGEADIVKLFPAGNFGMGYLKAIMGPFDELPFFAVGGIDLENIMDWLEAGAMGVGIGSVLTGSSQEKGLKESVAQKARAFVEKIKNHHARA
ncbi:bifunctional 4-hydroxy-2-oxoglutarate aldolase/2-dehydro-3-deoxy-phosphogluconate aldolase [Echinicola sediminis]